MLNRTPELNFEVAPGWSKPLIDLHIWLVLPSSGRSYWLEHSEWPLGRPRTAEEAVL